MSAAPTPLDAAFAAQAAAPEDAGLRLRFNERVLDAELLVPLEVEAGEAVEPRVYDLSDGRFVLAFDRDERLAAFLAAPARFAALSGRSLVALLAGRGIGVALNLGAPSATLIPVEAVDWLARLAAQAPTAIEARIEALAPPGQVPDRLGEALGPKLAAMATVIPKAWLVRARLMGGEDRLLLALAGVPEAAQAGVSAAVAEAVRFGVGVPELDVLFLEPGSRLLAAVARAGARLALPEHAKPRSLGPGMDPDRPPRLRQ